MHLILNDLEDLNALRLCHFCLPAVSLPDHSAELVFDAVASNGGLPLTSAAESDGSATQDLIDNDGGRVAAAQPIIIPLESPNAPQIFDPEPIIEQPTSFENPVGVGTHHASATTEQRVEVPAEEPFIPTLDLNLDDILREAL
eukprot:m.299592 g.299592  ORF g.299592 m.299592 type:complete len:143 (+) comp55191_c0_seq3:922-1350(+)